MRKFYFSGLISCSLLLAAAQTNAQSFEQNGDPVMVSSPNHTGLLAYAENNIIIIRWTSANERNIDRYIIERSDDSIHFTTLHELLSKGPVTTDAANTYEDADSYPATSTNYYRLRTVLRDGGAFYSSVVKVDIDARDLPVLKPTVLHMGGTLRLDNYRNQPVTVNIFNANGTLLGSWMVNSTSFNINTDRLARGILFYRISDETHPLIDAGKLMIQ
ncbi:MAG TPA: hypothetical protein VKQ52_13215 [Puia sp.]|nr:hypothetical protein [Puia sp.]